MALHYDDGGNAGVRTYVTSLRGNATRAHIGGVHGTACGFILTTAFAVVDAVPADREVCPRCVEVTELVADGGAIARRFSARDQAIIELLKEGLDNAGVARRLRLGLSTTARYINAAMRRVGARSRFQWGYIIGFAEGRTRCDQPTESAQLSELPTPDLTMDACDKRPG